MDNTIIQGELTNRIINGLVENGLMSDETIEEAVKIASESFRPLEEVLINEGFITREKLSSFIEKFLELPRVDLSSYVPDPEALKLVPKSYVHKYMVLPLFEIEGALTIALADALTVFRLDELSEEINLNLDPVLATEGSLIDAIIIYYGVTPDEIDLAEKSKKQDHFEDKEYSEEEMLNIDLDRLAIIEGEAVNDLLNEIFIKAKKAGAQSIHIEPIGGDFRLLFRFKDGLVKVGEAARSLQRPLIDQIKYLARMSKETSTPQEKITELPRAGRVLISSFPSVYGERMVINFLKDYHTKERLEDFGLSGEEVEKLKAEISKKSGLIIIGAPVSSGKTMLMRAILSLNASAGRSCFMLGPEEIMPVEGVQFLKLRGEELLSAIEGIVYQDVDVVGIDEVDSPEVVKAVIRLSEKTLTVVTVEASNVTDAIARFLELGAEPFSLSWNLNAVISTRLFEMNCVSCLEEYKSPLSSHKAVKKFIGEVAVFKRSKGCEECLVNPRYVIVPEILVMKDSISQRIASGFNEESFYNFIRTKAVETPLKRALELARDGVVSLEEVYKKTGFKE